MPSLLDQIAARIRGGVTPTAADRSAAIDAIIDTLGCMVAGSGDPATRAVRRMLTGRAGAGRSALAGGGEAGVSAAALLNGTAAHALDFDDNFGPGMSHASAVMVPALLAVAQDAGAGGAALVAGYLAGLEAQALVGAGLKPQHYTFGWHGTSTIAPIGSAAGAAVLLGLPQAQVVQAMSLAVSTASGPKGQFGTQAKPFHAGAGARNAAEAALLAQAGLSGREDILECPQGFGELFSGGEAPHWALPAPDQPHVIGTEGLSPKLHPCCGSTHNAVDMIHDLRREHGFGPEDVESIRLTVGLANFRNLAYPEPRDEMQGRFSMQYCVALALGQDVLSLADFTPTAVLRPGLRALFGRISMEVMSPEEERASAKPAHRAEVVLKDGRVLRAARSHARGTIAAPLDAAQKRAKFIDCLAVVPQSQAAALYDRLLGLEEMADLSLLAGVLALAETGADSAAA